MRDRLVSVLGNLRGADSLPMRVLTVDNDFAWAEALHATLREARDVETLENAKTFGSALDVARGAPVDLVFLEPSVTDGDGFRCAQCLALLPRPPRIALVTRRMDDVALWHSTEPHIHGYILKNEDFKRNVAAAFAALGRGGRYIQPDVVTALTKMRTSPNAFFKILSNRELELMPMFGAGMNNDGIAREMGLSSATIKYHRDKALQKLNLHSTRELMMWAASKGFCQAPPVSWRNVARHPA